MSKFTDNIAWAKFVTMQHRARGIPLANEHALRAELRMLRSEAAEQFKVLASQREEIMFLVKERKELSDRWLAAVQEINRLEGKHE